MSSTVESQGSDAADLQAFGYRNELKRTLGGVATFAASFSVISVVVGLFTAYQLGYAFSGPAVVWAVLAVAVGQFVVALVFAELAARYPIAGSVYQWSMRLGGPRWGFMTTWVYIWAWLVVLPSIAVGLQSTLLGISPHLHLLSGGAPEGGTLSFAQNVIVLAIILFIFTTLVNLAGVRWVAVAGYIGIVAEIVGLGLLFIVLVTHLERGPEVWTDSIGLGAGHSWGFFGALLVGAFLPLYIFIGFDTGASLAEETRDPRRNGPRSLLRSVAIAGVVAVIAAALIPMAISDLSNEEVSISGLQYVVGDLAGSTVGKILFADAAVAIICAGIAVQALTARLIFAMARDSELPFSHLLSRVSKKTRTPILATVIPGIIWTAIMVINLGNSKVFNAVLGVGVLLIFISYLAVCILSLRKRMAGELKPEPGLFSLRYGTAITVISVAWGLFCCVNLIWPRAEFYGPDWYQQYSALIVTGIVVVSGAVVLSLRKVFAPKVHLGETLAEHRAPQDEQI